MRLFEGTPWDQPPRCDRCGQLEADCGCPPQAAPPPARTAPEKQTARLVMEKRPGGRWMTIVRGLPAAENDLPALLTRLKAACGAGGAVKDDVLEIQGRHLDSVRQLLSQLGYRVKG